jgi:hypothetical protein
MGRKKVDKTTEAMVLTASRRRCCLCVFIDKVDSGKRGQIAHLNKDASDSKFENLVYLCLEHHDLYDSHTSQSKGYTEVEVRHWRDELYRRYPKSQAMKKEALKPTEAVRERSSVSGYNKVIAKPSNDLGFISRPWRYPLWQIKNQPEYFAFRAKSGFDGVCLVERIDLPDGRIVVACIQTAGNPGTSITNSVEEIALQVCERFEIPTDRLVWLEHYDALGAADEWRLVEFGTMPPKGHFAFPKWTKMTPELWHGLRLRPKKRIKVWCGQYESKLRKMFHWPMEALHD